MPEGDTIFRAARTLHTALAGEVVTHFDAAYAHVRASNVDHPVVGRTVAAVKSLGKNLLVEFSGDLILRTHMRMNGSWHIYRPNERWQRSPSAMRVVVGTHAYVAVGFDIPVVKLHTAKEWARSETPRHLGPDLLSPSFQVQDVLPRMLAHAHEPILDVLLDQSVMAGVGNVFKCELLFMQGIDPFTLTGHLDSQTLTALVVLARELLVANVAPSKGDGIVTHGLRRTTGRADPSARLWVYGRAGRPCRRCGALIARKLGGKHARSTYFCPQCQSTKPALMPCPPPV